MKVFQKIREAHDSLVIAARNALEENPESKLSWIGAKARMIVAIPLAALDAMVLDQKGNRALLEGPEAWNVSAKQTANVWSDIRELFNSEKALSKGVTRTARSGAQGSEDKIFLKIDDRKLNRLGALEYGATKLLQVTLAATSIGVRLLIAGKGIKDFGDRFSIGRASAAGRKVQAFAGYALKPVTFTGKTAFRATRTVPSVLSRATGLIKTLWNHKIKTLVGLALAAVAYAKVRGRGLTEEHGNKGPTLSQPTTLEEFSEVIEASKELNFSSSENIGEAKTVLRELTSAKTQIETLQSFREDSGTGLFDYSNWSRDIETAHLELTTAINDAAAAIGEDEVLQDLPREAAGIEGVENYFTCFETVIANIIGKASARLQQPNATSTTA